MFASYMTKIYHWKFWWDVFKGRTYYSFINFLFILYFKYIKITSLWSLRKWYEFNATADFTFYVNFTIVFCI